MQNFTPEQTQATQLRIGRLAIEASTIDLDGFIAVTEAVASPQAAASGINIAAVNSAAGWAELARLLKPFRDRSAAMVERIRAEREGLDDDLVPPGAACPRCGELHVDELALQEDGGVDCASCGTHYQLPDEKRGGQA